MIGTRAPSTMPAMSRFRQIFKLFGEHVTGFEIGHHEDVCAPSDRRNDAFGFRGVLRHGIVEGERAVESRQ